MHNSPLGRVVVVGAGLIGASIAYRLAQAGWDVAIVDGGNAGEGASKNSFSWVNAHGKSPLAYQELNRSGMGEHHMLAAELRTTSTFTATGSSCGTPRWILPGRVQRLAPPGQHGTLGRASHPRLTRSPSRAGTGTPSGR